MDDEERLLKEKKASKNLVDYCLSDEEEEPIVPFASVVFFSALELSKEVSKYEIMGSLTKVMMDLNKRWREDDEELTP